jgi:hypothetical protein
MVKEEGAGTRWFGNRKTQVAGREELAGERGVAGSDTECAGES